MLPPRRHNRLAALPALLVLAACASCNPFAPAAADGDPFSDLLGNPRTISGFFANFQNAYELRDAALYEPLLDSGFVFIYYDFEDQVERQWGFAQEINTTRRLFQNADLIRLRWNQIIFSETAPSGLQASVTRSFNLTVTLADNDVFRGDGNVNFTLVRPDSTAAWQLRRWRDESEF